MRARNIMSHLITSKQAAHCPDLSCESSKIQKTVGRLDLFFLDKVGGGGVGEDKGGGEVGGEGE